MIIRKVAVMGNPVLRLRAAEIPPERIGDPETLTLAEDLVATMREYGGIGLAATQVHESKRMVVVYLPGPGDQPDPIPLAVLINPLIEPVGEGQIEVLEGCLSVPGIQGTVPRHAEVRVEYTDLNGENHVVTASGVPAAVYQHEIDHLDGVLFVDRVEDTRSLAFDKEAARR